MNKHGPKVFSNRLRRNPVLGFVEKCLSVLNPTLQHLVQKEVFNAEVDFHPARPEGRIHSFRKDHLNFLQLRIV